MYAHKQFLDSSFIATVKCAEESWPLRGYNGIAVVISSNYKNIVYTHAVFIWKKKYSQYTYTNINANIRLSFLRVRDRVCVIYV